MEKPEWGDPARSLLLAGELEAREEKEYRVSFPDDETPLPQTGTPLLHTIIFEGANVCVIILILTWF